VVEDHGEELAALAVGDLVDPCSRVGGRAPARRFTTPETVHGGMTATAF
jgi:hypothetical protein